MVTLEELEQRVTELQQRMDAMEKASATFFMVENRRILDADTICTYLGVSNRKLREDIFKDAEQYGMFKISGRVKMRTSDLIKYMDVWTQRKH